MHEGKLPNFAALAGSGGFSPLATSNPPQSPVAWSSIATGNNPGRHGIYDFLTRRPKDYLPDLGILKMKQGELQLTGPSFIPPGRERPSGRYWRKRISLQRL